MIETNDEWIMEKVMDVTTDAQTPKVVSCVFQFQVTNVTNSKLKSQTPFRFALYLRHFFLTFPFVREATL
jgi:hypothetical protein